MNVTHHVKVRETITELRKRTTATSWGSSGRRFKSCQPDTQKPAPTSVGADFILSGQGAESSPACQERAEGWVASCRSPGTRTRRAWTDLPDGPNRVTRVFPGMAEMLVDNDQTAYGEVFTRRWVVDTIRDLVGYTADRRPCWRHLRQGRNAVPATIVRESGGTWRSDTRAR